MQGPLIFLSQALPLIRRECFMALSPPVYYFVCKNVQINTNYDGCLSKNVIHRYKLLAQFIQKLQSETQSLAMGLLKQLNEWAIEQAMLGIYLYVIRWRGDLQENESYQHTLKNQQVEVAVAGRAHSSQNCRALGQKGSLMKTTNLNSFCVKVPYKMDGRTGKGGGKQSVRLFGKSLGEVSSLRHPTDI